MSEIENSCYHCYQGAIGECIRCKYGGVGDVFNEIPPELHYMEKIRIRVCGYDSLKLGYKILKYHRYHGYNYLVFKCLDKSDIEHSHVEYLGEYHLLDHVHYWIQYDIHKEGNRDVVA